MKLLLDQNLSPRLVQSLVAVYPGTSHVREVGLHAADDEAVWAHAAEEGFVIVSRDADFLQRSFVLGHPRRSCGSAVETVRLLRSRRCSWPVVPNCSPSSEPKRNHFSLCSDGSEPPAEISPALTTRRTDAGSTRRRNLRTRALGGRSAEAQFRSSSIQRMRFGSLALR